MRGAGESAVIDVLRAAAKPPEDADPRALTHGFHAWPARMHPFTAARLIAASPPGVIADPFMGGGTVLVEALLAGRPALGGDVNPIAVEVAWARTRCWAPGRTAGLEETARDVVAAAKKLREARPVPPAIRASEREWFDPPALAEAWSLAEVLRPAIARGDDVARMLRACLSSIIVKASRQVSDSVPMRDTAHAWIPSHRVEGWFVARAREHGANLAALADRLPRSAQAPWIALADARYPPPAPGPLAAIITSPPYPGVYDYAAHHERRYSVLGIDAGIARTAEIGARREVRHAGTDEAGVRYVEGMATVLAAWRRHLVPNGRIYMVVGDGQDPTGPIPVIPLMQQAARQAGCAFVAAISQPRPSYGPGGGGGSMGTKEEHIIALGRGES